MLHTVAGQPEVVVLFAVGCAADKVVIDGILLLLLAVTVTALIAAICIIGVVVAVAVMCSTVYS